MMPRRRRVLRRRTRDAILRTVRCSLRPIAPCPLFVALAFAVVGAACAVEDTFNRQVDGFSSGTIPRRDVPGDVPVQYGSPGGGGGVTTTPHGGTDAGGGDVPQAPDDTGAADAADPGTASPPAGGSGLTARCSLVATSPVFDCGAVCAAISACGPTAGCDQACSDAARIYSDTALSQLATCGRDTNCSALPIGSDGAASLLQDHCITVAAANLAPSGQTACESLRARRDTCATNAEERAAAATERDACLAFHARALRPDLHNAISLCANRGCDDVDDCLDEQLCGFRLRQDGAGSWGAFP